MEVKLKNIIADVMGVDPKEINDNSSPNTIASWDSLKQMNLITVLEEEFDIELSDEQVIRILDYKSLVDILKEETI